jgi:hypothetical protein
VHNSFVAYCLKLKDMKKLSIILLVYLLGSISLYSQFTIKLNNGETLEARRVVIPPRGEAVKCILKDHTKPEIKKTDIFCIIRGKQIIAFGDNKLAKGGKLLGEMKEMNINDTCAIAIVDAIRQQKVGGAAFGTGIVSVIAWPVGLITAIVISSTPPSEANMNISSSKLSDNKYCDCYKKEAIKKKKAVTWMGWGLGTTFGIALSSLIIML